MPTNVNDIDDVLRRQALERALFAFETSKPKASGAGFAAEGPTDVFGLDYHHDDYAMKAQQQSPHHRAWY